MKPIIAVSPLYDEERESVWMLPGYLQMISECGAVPITLPFDADASDVDQLLQMCDGLLLTGGQDVSPALYGAERIPECGPRCELKDAFEMEALQVAEKKDLPVLGICRGIQVMNVHRGGTLWQDIKTQNPSDVEHKMAHPYDRKQHRVELVEDAPLQRLLKLSEIGVNSLHHQAVRELGEHLKPMAHSEDGIVEAVYDPRHRFFWGVQWHPETTWMNDPHQLEIVHAFVNAARNRWL